MKVYYREFSRSWRNRVVTIEYKNKDGYFQLERELSFDEKIKEGGCKQKPYTSMCTSGTRIIDEKPSFLTKTEELTEPLEYYGLLKPEPYLLDKLEIKEEKDTYITDEMIEYIKKEKIIRYDIVFSDAADKNENGDYELSNEALIYCTKCGKIRKGTFYNRCDCDSRWSSVDRLIDTGYTANKAIRYASYSHRDKKSHSKKKSLYYLRLTGNKIRIDLINIKCECIDGTFTTNYSIPSSVIHEIGGERSGYKNRKTTQKPCDVFDALNIGSSHASLPVLCEGYNNFFEMVLANEDFFKKCGFIDTMKYFKEVKYDLGLFFMTFIAIINKYPVLEQIIKCGYPVLFFKIYNGLICAGNKQSMKQLLDSVADIVDNNATKGKMAMRFPEYIGDYLVRKDANLNEYKFWITVYELTHISKEQFDDIINSFEYAFVFSQVTKDTIENILKYGYSFKKLCKYLVKMTPSYEYSVYSCAYTLSDYLRICELMDVKPDLFPQDLKKQHDDIALAYEAVQNEVNDKIISAVAKKCEVVMEKVKSSEKGKKMLKDYVVLFPHCTTDFVNEGNAMHNCVGSYASRVVSGQNIVFFLRKEDTPEESFITGEVVSSGLRQFYLSNNRIVQNDSLKETGKFIASEILKVMKKELN